MSAFEARGALTGMVAFTCVTPGTSKFFQPAAAGRYGFTGTAPIAAGVIAGPSARVFLSRVGSGLSFEESPPARTGLATAGALHFGLPGTRRMPWALPRPVR